MTVALKRLGWVLITVGAVGVFGYAAVQYLAFDPAKFPDEFRESFKDHQAGLYVHIFGAMIALILGPVQFYLRRLEPPRRRAAWLPMHRWLGKAYVTGAVTGGAGGFSMSFFSFGGLPDASRIRDPYGAHGGHHGHGVPPHPRQG